LFRLPEFGANADHPIPCFFVDSHFDKECEWFDAVLGELKMAFLPQPVQQRTLDDRLEAYMPAKSPFLM